MSECACVYMAGGGDNAPLCCRTRLVTARKVHRCCECRRTIEIGERYELVTGRWQDDDKFRAYKTCDECREIRYALVCDGDWYFGGLWEAIGESDINPVACVNELTSVRAKQKFAQWFRDDLGLEEEA